MGVPAAGDPADHALAIGSGVPHGLVADHIGRVIGIGIDDEHRQLALRPARGAFGLDGGAADELVIELQDAVHPRLERGVDRPVLAEPGAEVLLEAHRDQGPEPEQAHVELVARLPQQVEEVALVLGLHPDLVPEIAGVRHARQPDRGHAEVDRAERHEREVGGRQRCLGELLQHVARSRSGNRQPDHRQGEHLEANRARLREMVDEPAWVMHLCCL